MAWIRTKIKINENLGPAQRVAVAQSIIDHMIDRTLSGVDKNGRPFPGYSKIYKESLAFKIAGKKASKVNLKQTGEMLNSIKLLNQRKGEITVGFERNDDVNNGKAEAHITGVYGNSNKIKKRDFLGIQKRPLNNIVKKFDIDKAKTVRENAEILARIRVFQEFGDD